MTVPDCRSRAEKIQKSAGSVAVTRSMQESRSYSRCCFVDGPVKDKDVVARYRRSWPDNGCDPYRGSAAAVWSPLFTIQRKHCRPAGSHRQFWTTRRPLKTDQVDGLSSGVQLFVEAPQAAWQHPSRSAGAMSMSFLGRRAAEDCGIRPLEYGHRAAGSHPASWCNITTTIPILNAIILSSIICAATQVIPIAIGVCANSPARGTACSTSWNWHESSTTAGLLARRPGPC